LFEQQEKDLGVNFAAMRTAMDKLDEPTKLSRGRLRPPEADEE
jgi:hypothetical protein